MDNKLLKLSQIDCWHQCQKTTNRMFFYYYGIEKNVDKIDLFKNSGLLSYSMWGWVSLRFIRWRAETPQYCLWNFMQPRNHPARWTHFRSRRIGCQKTDHIPARLCREWAENCYLLNPSAFELHFQKFPQNLNSSRRFSNVLRKSGRFHKSPSGARVRLPTAVQPRRVFLGRLEWW